MGDKKYFEAVLHYTKGIKYDPFNPHIYSNRSAAFLKIQQYYHSLDDANTVIRMLPKWAKGYYRKGEVLCAVEQYKEAVQTYQKGLEAVPDDPELKRSLQSAMQHWMKQRQEENRMPWFGVTFGALVSVLFVAFDELVAVRPIIPSDALRALLVAVLVVVCYYLAVLYRYFIRSQRNSLLEAPLDLMNDDESKSMPDRVAGPGQPPSSESATNRASPSGSGDAVGSSSTNKSALSSTGKRNKKRN